MAMFRRYMYHSHRRFSGVAYWLSRRFTIAGKFALACLLAATLLGLDTNQTTAYQAFTFLIIVLGVSFLWTLVQRFDHTANRISVQRQLPRFGTAGQPVVYRLTFKNETPRPQRAWTLLENLEDPRPTLAEFIAKPARPIRGWFARFDSFLGYSRWWQLMAHRQMVVIGDQLVPDLSPHGEAEVRVEMTPKRRGRVHFNGLTLARTDLFGLMRAQWRRDLPQSLLVLPKRYLLPRLALPGVREYQPAGVALASAVGNSDEFVALRDYRPGDPLRHIHWSSVAKTDRLIVREHEDEFFVRHALILDTFAAPEQEDVFEEAVSVAASFVCAIQTQESLLDLLFVGPEAYCFTAGRGVGNVDRMLEVLAGVSRCADKPFPSLESLVLRHAGRVSGCVCVFVAWDEPRQRLVKLLQSLSVPLRVCVLTDSNQTEPLDRGPMRDQPQNFQQLKLGHIQEILSRL